jgi:peptide/nickel transport system permease protein
MADGAETGGRGLSASSAVIRKERIRGVSKILKRYRAAAVGGVLFCVAVLLAILAPLISPYDPAEQNVPERLQGPSARHLLGTDDFGRDSFSRIAWGARPVLAAALASVILSLFVGGVIGLIAGYWGGLFDGLLMRIMDVILSFPLMLLALLIVATLGPGLVNSIFAIAFSQIPTFARLVRSSVMSISRQQYIEAARSTGGSNSRIIVRHVLPNLVGPIIVQATATLALIIGYLSGLSFLGLGVQPPTADWGLMVADGRRLIYSYPLIPFLPGIAITLTVVGLNFLGDGLRDYLDPTMRRS